MWHSKLNASISHQGWVLLAWHLSPTLFLATGIDLVVLSFIWTTIVIPIFWASNSKYKLNYPWTIWNLWWVVYDTCISLRLTPLLLFFNTFTKSMYNYIEMLVPNEIIWPCFIRMAVVQMIKLIVIVLIACILWPVVTVCYFLCVKGSLHINYKRIWKVAWIRSLCLNESQPRLSLMAD